MACVSKTVIFCRSPVFFSNAVVGGHTERNSVRHCHVFGSELDMKKDVRNLGSFPMKRVPQNCVFQVVWAWFEREYLQEKPAIYKRKKESKFWRFTYISLLNFATHKGSPGIIDFRIITLWTRRYFAWIFKNHMFAMKFVPAVVWLLEAPVPHWLRP